MEEVPKVSHAELKQVFSLRSQKISQGAVNGADCNYVRKGLQVFFSRYLHLSARSEGQEPQRAAQVSQSEHMKTNDELAETVGDCAINVDRAREREDLKQHKRTQQYLILEEKLVK